MRSARGALNGVAGFLYLSAMKRVLPLLFWAAVFLTFLTPMELGDIWWHLRTGQWILENGSIPAEDPFALRFELYSGPFVLREFWLCQILLYLVYSAGGFVSLIVLKALLFTATVFVVDRTLKIYGLGAPLRCLLLLPIIVLATGYDEIRPQSFSFLFFSLTLYLLERGHGPLFPGGREGSPPFRPYRGIFLLPPMMLLWANVHGGIVMGAGVSVAYALHEAFFRRRRLLPAVVLFALGLSLLNPNGPHAFTVAKDMFMMSAAGTTTIHEHLPFGAFVAMTGERHLYFALIALMALGALSFVVPFFSGKRPEVLGLVLFTGLAYAALTSFKAGLFFSLLGVPVMGKNLSVLISGRASGRAPAYIASALFLALTILFVLPRTVFTRPVINEALMPVKAAGFIESASLPGNIYHPYEWGGYLIWRLYPKHKVFIDGRMIPGNDAMLKQWRDVLEAKKGWNDILLGYGVNTAAYWPLLPYAGGVPPIIFALLKDEGWKPVYWDMQSIIFVRSGLARNPINKNAVWELLTSLASLRIISDPSSAPNHSTLGEIYLERGFRADAEREFRSALAINPGEKRAEFYIRDIRGLLR